MKRVWWTKWAVVGLLVGTLLGCQKAEQPEPEYTYIYSEAPKPPVVANAMGLEGSPSMGAADAKVTIIESSDFQCPFCGRVVPTMKKLLEQYPNDVRVIFKHNPLGFHKRAMPAAKAAMAAHAQGKFWEFHDKLFQQKRFEDADFERYAQELGLDLTAFKATYSDPAVEAKILHDQKSMVSAGAGGTPAFFVNGKLVSGAKPLSAFQAEVNSAIVEADKMLASGVSKDDLFRAVLAKNVNKAFADAVVDGTPVVGGPAPRKPRTPAPPADTKPVTIDFDGSDPVFGPDSAKVTIAIFSDFECPFCSKLVPTMSQIKKEYADQVRFVFKQHPLSFHKNARLAAKASLAANEQGKFWEYHDVLFANMKALKRADLIRYAGDMGMDIAKFEAAMDAPRMEAAIKEDLAAAQKIGVRGTPHSFVNGKRIKGARPFASFKSFIDEELGVKKKRLNRP
jgi:protein-disulfide isomerase